MRVLVGTVGYQNLRNYSLGPILYPELRRILEPEVQVEELNWGPVAIAQRLEAEQEPFDRIVLVSARPDQRPEGTLSIYRWLAGLPDPQEIQARIGEAVSGVISVDNLLIVGEFFGVWPAEVFLVDVAPGPEEAGPDLRSSVKKQVPLVIDHVVRLARQGWTSGNVHPLPGNQIDGGLKITTSSQGMP